MPPKGKKGKGKKGDDDDDAYWEAKAAKSTPPTATTPKPEDDDSEDDQPKKKNSNAASGFAALAAQEDENGGGDDDEAQGGGGLMGAIKKSSNKKKDKKKGGRSAAANFDNDEDLDEDASSTPAAPEEPTFQVAGDDEWPEDEVKPKKGKKSKGKHSKHAAAEDEEEPLEESVAKLAISEEPTIQTVGDDEWPEEEVKTKKGKGGGKKGGKKNKAQADEDEDEFGNPIVAAPITTTPAAAAAVTTPTPAVAEDAGADSDAEEGGETKVLTKKEKEQRKKEKEKAKKKAQQAAKKAATTSTTTDDVPPPSPTTTTTETPAAAAAEGEDDDGEEGGAVGGDKKKNNKKKKKKTAAAEPVAAAAPAKAPTGKLAVLRAALEAKKAADEAAAKKAEEQRLRIEEEEARVAEEERIAEEAKQKRKEKEKAKRDLAKKEGRLLTPKQRQEKAAAEARLQALLASGVTIEGLKNDDVEGGAAEEKKPKKVVYGNKKKKGPQQPKVEVPVVEEKKVEEEVAKVEEDDGEDDWEKSDEEEVVVPKVEEKKVEEEEGDDWDASSVEEEVAAPPPPPAPAPAAAKPKPTPASKPKGKAAAAEESSSSEDDDDDDDSDSDSDSDDDSDDSDSDDDDSSDEEELTPAQKRQAATAAEAARVAEQKLQEARQRRVERHNEALAARSAEDLRSPICCILGHVDTGKTKLLDKIRQTNVQEGEAGGITQQIGATYFPVEAIKTKTAVINKDGTYEYKIPGLLVIDTPGHESFSNLRTRGSSLCNIAILVVDIMHGLEPQTLESLKLLRDKKTPFIVALNKIDRIYGWNPTPNGAFQESLAGQTTSVKREFADRVEKTKVAFAEQGLNSTLYYENKNLGRNVSLVPTSAITGEGIPDMIQLLVDLTQQRMTESLMYISELECTVLEVKVIEGLGTTIDVILSNGYLREGDRIVVCGLNGPIFTNVRALLTPQPLREMRVKSAYVHHKEVKAALGIKITAPDLEKAIAGSRLLVVGPEDDEEDLGEEVMSDLQNLLSWVDKSGRGVSVQASTLGSLEALLDFLKSSKIPVSTINIGPVHKRDVIQASTMLEKAKELACMLCFDVPVDKEAEKLADELGVRLFKADIIYHLFDKFTAYNKEVQDAKKVLAAGDAYWPCRLKIIQTFARRDPIVIGVDILDGTLRVGTPLCVVKTEVDNSTKPPTTTKTIIDIGRITSIEKNHEVFQKLTKKNIGAGAAIKVEAIINQPKLQVGRHFEETDELYSHITRNSIDVMKEHFRAEAEPSDWTLIKKLKPLLDIA